MAWLTLLNRGIKMHKNEGEPGNNQELVRTDKNFRIVQRLSLLLNNRRVLLPIKS